MQPNSAVPEAVTAPSRTVSPGTYVLYREVDAFVTGDPAHTKICRVIDDRGHAPAGHLLLVDLATKELIQYAPVLYIRPLDPAEFMTDIDSAPLTLVDDGLLVSAAAAWLITQRGRIGGAGQGMEVLSATA
ncbi:hypothetical protein AB0D10_41650 [Kitasatospora sp. NPDC048545]|uniref:hypothetical protein n=1 Tax=Kitasatospora sp. NPDC048545 TaxID=3157208 RepID=UPI0033D3738E